MANIRRGFGDDLTLKNGNLGINTTAQEKVDVVGVVKGTRPLCHWCIISDCL